MICSRNRHLVWFIVVGTVLVGAGIFWDCVVLGNRSFGFYGRIVDEHGLGLPGVVLTVRISTTDFFNVPVPGGIGLTSHFTYRTAATDANGDFYLKGWRGSAIVISKFVKLGYRPTYEGKRTVFVFTSNYARDPTPVSPELRITYRMERVPEKTPNHASTGTALP